MSYFYYMACSQALETGLYAHPPTRIYPSYSTFMESLDYRLFEQKQASFKHLKPNPDKPENPRKADGQVHVFEHFRDNYCLEIYPFAPTSERDSELEFVAAQFTLPHLYQIDYFDPNFFCKYLYPDDRLVFLCVFLGHGDPLQPPVTGTFDLQDYVDGKLCMEDIYEIISTPPDNTLTHVLPPRTPQTHLKIVPADFSDVICTVCLDNADEAWNRRKLRGQGLL